MADSIPVSKRRRTDQRESQDDAVESSNLKKLSPLVVFAHGAGAPSTSDWMIRWKEMLGEALHAVEVVTFDYPCKLKLLCASYWSSYDAVSSYNGKIYVMVDLAGGKKRAPPKAEKLVEFHADMVKKAVAEYPGHPLILAGKSMGSRVSCMVASQKDISASAIVCLGYPLKGMNGAIRDEILVQLAVPVMFVQGSKDGLCPLDKLNAVRKRIKPINDLHVIEGGDHSFKIGKKHLQATGVTQNDAEESAVQSVASFVANSLCEL